MKKNIKISIIAIFSIIIIGLIIYFSISQISIVHVKKYTPSGTKANYVTLMKHFMENEKWYYKDGKVVVEGETTTDTELSRIKIGFNYDGSFSFIGTDNTKITDNTGVIAFTSYMKYAIDTYNYDTSNGINAGASFQDRYMKYLELKTYTTYKSNYMDAFKIYLDNNPSWSYSINSKNVPELQVSGTRREGTSTHNYTFKIIFDISEMKFTTQSVIVDSKEYTDKNVNGVLADVFSRADSSRK